jgi:hypothetical protein
MTPASLQTIAHDELRLALAARRDGQRVTYPARKADQLVRVLHALHPAQTTAAALENAIVTLRRVLRDLPAKAAKHVARALKYAEDALKLHQASAA